MQSARQRFSASIVRTIPLPSGRPIPVLGQGTWLMGQDPAKREDEIAALRLGVDLGIRLIDTAEMYGDGAAEELIGEAVADRRDELFLVSKVLPNHATVRGTIDACVQSLTRLQTSYLDLYLLHWRGDVPLGETLEGFRRLKHSGEILDYGVSNFDVDDMEEAVSLAGGDQIVTDQVLYNLKHRGIEWDLLPWCRKRGIPVMAYSPFEHSRSEQKGMLDHPIMKKIASRYDATPAQIALAWVLQQDVVVIPKASKPKHVKENRAALELELNEDDLKELDLTFPPPDRKIPLEVK